MSIQSSHLAAIVLGGLFLLGGCGPEATGGEAEEGAAEPLATHSQAVISGWTSLTSEEYPPITCDGGSLPSTVRCYGSSCDDMQFYCRPTGASPAGSYWTPYFSEEDSAMLCNPGYLVTGLSCDGRYCDDLSLRCTLMAGTNPRNCRWTGWMSEEHGGSLSFESGFYPRGVQCEGGYCDNLRYYICQI